jgi:hypothetical protein
MDCCEKKAGGAGMGCCEGRMPPGFAEKMRAARFCCPEMMAGWPERMGCCGKEPGEAKPREEPAAT